MSLYRLYDQDEDTATLALAALMQSEPAALRAFTKLAAPEAPTYKTPWSISPQHRTFRGRRIDIFIRNGDFSIVVEAKVRDGIKAFQFDHYVRHVIENETGRYPELVWLVQKPRAAIGFNASKARLITWNDLHQAFSGLPQPAVQLFCADLISCGIVLPGIIKSRQKIHKGYDPDYAVSVLRKVRESVDGLEGDVEENTRTPLSLHVGRTEWNLHWRTRVWFYFQPLVHSKANVDAYKFVCHLILYNREHDLFEPARIERWSTIMQEHGLIFKRNQPGKWKTSGEQLAAPLIFTSKTGLRGVFGDPAEAVCHRFAFDWRDEKAAVNMGYQFLSWGLQVIDDCLEE